MADDAIRHPDWPMWRDLTDEQREWFTRGWNASGEGFNADYGCEHPSGAYDYVRRGDGFYEPDESV